MAENVKISINTEAIMKAFAKLQKVDHSDLFRKIAGIMADATEQAFADEKDSTTGKKWQNS